MDQPRRPSVQFLQTGQPHTARAGALRELQLNTDSAWACDSVISFIKIACTFDLHRQARTSMLVLTFVTVTTLGFWYIRQTTCARCACDRLFSQYHVSCR